MPKLHIEEYTRALAGKSVFIACREGILRDHFHDIIADLKFLNRQGVRTTLFHNMSNRFSNQKHFRELSSRLPETRIVKILPDLDFYHFVLDFHDHVYKFIFLERKYLIDRKGIKINAINTRRVRDAFGGYADLIANVNFKGALEKICRKIDTGHCDRVHILPAGKRTIKYELFTIEGSGTLIANNFEEAFGVVANRRETEIISGILNMYKHEAYLKPRSVEYIQKKRDSFFVTKIDGIIVGCVEKKKIDTETIELGAVAISTKFINQRVGVFTINAFVDQMAREGYRRFISLTNSPQLKKLYTHLGFSKGPFPQYGKRQNQSPEVTMYLKEI
ncbi:MAG: GNAT family N-acetyltransferase [Deltaproteobacteria bacterium]|nr:GNAT family N-acetyltransferase [Deltaproteobacteria bacterium]MBW2676170.1 GNAT family N-acetyltransferase [Deltaproteobacteria bacterium]